MQQSQAVSSEGIKFSETRQKLSYLHQCIWEISLRNEHLSVKDKIYRRKKHNDMQNY